MRIARVTVLIALLLFAVGGASAYAQTAPSVGYDESLGVIGEIQSEEPTPPGDREEQPTPPAQEQHEESNLPFTGLDLGIVALMGAAPLGTGLVLRRTTRHSPAG